MTETGKVPVPGSGHCKTTDKFIDKILPADTCGQNVETGGRESEGLAGYSSMTSLGCSLEEGTLVPSE